MIPCQQSARPAGRALFDPQRGLLILHILEKVKEAKKQRNFANKTINSAKNVLRVFRISKMFVKNAVDCMAKSGYDTDRIMTCEIRLFKIDLV